MQHSEAKRVVKRMKNHATNEATDSGSGGAADLSPESVLVTGGAGFIGHRVVRDLAAAGHRVVATDIRPYPGACPDGVTMLDLDVRAAELETVMAEHAVTRVVHLASVVEPPPGMDEATLRSIDVGGTQNVLDACVANGVQQLILTSSGAAYGYSPDNPVPLVETDTLRGHHAFAYAIHKRDVEFMLADYRDKHPALKQLIFRPGTILGDGLNNQITNLFRKPRIIGMRGTDSPFVFIYDEDVSAVIRKGIADNADGIFNLAGDGWLPLPDAAQILGKPFLAVPPGVVATALRILSALRLSRYGPAQVDFLRYRPVLDNAALKNDFGFTPSMSSRDAFLRWAKSCDLVAA